jgi:hypothetical protein
MQGLPWTARLRLILGVFAMFSVLGFFIDLMGLRHQNPLTAVLVMAVGSGSSRSPISSASRMAGAGSPWACWGKSG